jgi:CheY-like chemotaxis protein
MDNEPQHIIGMSANSDAETRDDAVACGMNAFIPKPVRVHELLKLVPSLQLKEDDA